MEHSHRHECGNVEQNSYIEVADSALEDRADEVHSKYDPDNGNGDINWPFELGIFLAGG